MLKLIPLLILLVSFQAMSAIKFTTYKFEKRNLQYAWSGDPSRPVLLFVHGSPGNWETWRAYLNDETLQKNFFMIAIDRMGYGPHDKKPEVAFEKQAQAALSAVPNEGLASPITLVGYSFGGPLIVHMATLAPERVTSLVFVSSSFIPGSERIEWYHRLGNTPLIHSLLPSSIQNYLTELAAADKQLELLPNMVDGLRNKVAILHGDADDVLPVENARQLIQHLQSATITHEEIVKGGDHHLPEKHLLKIKTAILSTR